MPIGRKKAGYDKWLYASEGAIDFETTILSEAQKEQFMQGQIDAEHLEVEAYSVQIGLNKVLHRPDKNRHLKPVLDDNGYPISRRAVYIFLDQRIKKRYSDTFRLKAEREMPDSYGQFTELNVQFVDGDVVLGAVNWLFDELDRRGRNKDKHIRLAAFNAGFEDSYAAYTLLANGFTNNAIPRAMSGVQVSTYTREIPVDIDESYREILEIVEAAGHWAAGTRLSDVFQMSGLSSKTETPMYERVEDVVANKDYLLYAARDVRDLNIALERKKKLNYDLLKQEMETVNNKVSPKPTRAQTASGTTLDNHKQLFIAKHGTDEYNMLFVKSDKEFDAWLRPLTMGGFNYANPVITDEFIDNATIIGIDRTNAYLSVMVQTPDFPVSSPVRFYGRYEESADWPFYYQEVIIKRGVVRPNKIPYVQYRKLGLAESVENFSTCDEVARHQILTRNELELIYDCYDIDMDNDIDYCGGYMFATKSGDYLFGDYLADKFNRRRAKKAEIVAKKAEINALTDATRNKESQLTAELIALEAEADTLKLWGNGLYGKTYENPEKENFSWKIIGDNIEQEIHQEELKRGSPSYIGANVLREQRIAIVKMANALLARGHQCLSIDTDCGTFLIDKDQANITPKQLCLDAGIVYGEGMGEYHEEKFAKCGIILAKKVYLLCHEQLTDYEKENYTIKELKAKGYKFHIGTRGVRKSNAEEQLTPAQWRRGQDVITQQMIRVRYGRKAMVNIRKKLAIE